MQELEFHVRLDPGREEWVITQPDQEPRDVTDRELRYVRKRDAEAAARARLRAGGGGSIVIHSASEAISEHVSVPSAA
jgi:hypothetical protein